MNARPILDRRIQRTRQLLQESLFQLIIERGYEHMSVQDITEQANLGRTTFYLHYREKEDLLRESIKALLNDLQLEVEPDAQETCSYNVSSLRIFQHVARRKPLYQAMLQEAGTASHLGGVLRSYFTELCQRIPIQQPQQTRCPLLLQGELFAAHAAGSLFGLISWWLEQEHAPSAEHMGLAYYRLMTSASDEKP